MAMNARSTTAATEGDSTAASQTPSMRPVAVIDIGTTLIRMAIAEIGPEGDIRRLETLSQAVNLGKDTFTTGEIRKSTIEDCVRVLRSYQRVLREFQIESPSQIRVVATSAVREANNRLAFLDRIYVATGIEVEPIDEAEVNRITYLGIQPLLKAEEQLASAQTIVIEVGGGNTEVLIIRDDDVLFAHTYRLGSLRLRETLESYRAPLGQMRTIMESHIRRTVEQVAQHVDFGQQRELIAIGGDVRFAASQLLPDWNLQRPGRLSVDELEEFTQRVLSMSEDELSRTHHLSFADAETLGPALLAYVGLARGLQIEELFIANVNLRDGLLQDVASDGVWTKDFNNQIIRSALELGRKFDFDEAHALQVAELSQTLFRALAEEHQLGSRYELMLYVAALLHEIGLFVSSNSHHKHSMYLIRNSELFGLSENDVLLVSLVARYHRRASPKPAHEGYSGLDRDRRVAVAKLGAILRLADALDRSRSQRIHDIQCSRDEGRFIISAPHVDDLTLEQLALKQKGTFFEEVFGMQAELRKAAD
jgi:exopolyphosphatase/guanosine-5'-triphosphate,3'-diphosphate pyrophosphatase